MTKLEKIEASVRDLSAEDFRRFSEWFAELQADRWDKQIEADARAGRLDELVAQARSEVAEGKIRPL